MKALVYLLQVSACTAIFYGFYFLLLRRYTFFTLNRLYLVATLLLSFLIPALQIPVNTSASSAVMQPVIYAQQMRERPQAEVYVTAATPIDHSFDWVNAVQVAYIAMAVISIGHLLYTLWTFFSRLNSKQLMKIGNVKVLKGSKALGNSSFLNVIFINDDELEPHEVKQIITHEMLHVRLMHSTDRLLARIIQIILWFNPFAYFYIRSIEENHEFEVDRIVAGDDGKGMYAQLLFKLAVSGQSYLFHNFSKVPLKKRISMLFNQPTSNMKKIVYVLILPMLVISCLAFANLEKDAQPARLSAVGELKGIGKHPLVVIDGKEYSSEILYTISGSCITSTSISPAPADKKYGPKAKDGYVEITTAQKQIVYLTATEKENLAKEAALPRSFYARLTLKNNDGTAYDKVIIRMPSGGKMTNDIGVAEKPLFVVDGEQFTEADVATIENLVKTKHIRTFSTGGIKFSADPRIREITGYKNYFSFQSDTTNGINKYRQRIRRNGKEIKGEEERDHKAAQLLFNSEQFKTNKAKAEKVTGKTLPYKVIAVVDTNYKGFIGHVNGYKVSYDGSEYLLASAPGKFTISGLLQPGDEVKVETGAVLYGKDQPVVMNPLSLEKNGKVIYNLSGADRTPPKYAFLYEANAVRFTDGKLTQLQKYANGKWKSAVVEIDGGYRIKLNLKPNAPSFDNIKPGDQVRFRFVHEEKTGDKDYTVNDWVALSNNIKEYGVKNPEYFSRFYAKI